MKATDIIELDNGEKFLLVSETEYQGEKYFLAQRYGENDELIPEEYHVFKGFVEDGEEYVDLVENEKIVNEVYKGFAIELEN